MTSGRVKTSLGNRRDERGREEMFPSRTDTLSHDCRSRSEVYTRSSLEVLRDDRNQELIPSSELESGCFLMEV